MQNVRRGRSATVRLSMSRMCLTGTTSQWKRPDRRLFSNAMISSSYNHDAPQRADVSTSVILASIITDQPSKKKYMMIGRLPHVHIVSTTSSSITTYLVYQAQLVVVAKDAVRLHLFRPFQVRQVSPNRDDRFHNRRKSLTTNAHPKINYHKKKGRQSRSQRIKARMSNGRRVSLIL